MPRNRWAALAELHGIVIIWGFTGILGNELSFSSVPLVFWRVVVALIGVGAYLFFTKQSLTLQRGNIKWMLSSGLLMGLHWVFFFAAIKHSNVSTALVSLSTTTLFVALVGPLVHKEKWKIREFLGGGLTMAGMALVVGFEPQYGWGIAYGLLAALLAALFSSINGRLVKSENPAVMSAVGLGSALLFLLAVIAFSDQTLEYEKWTFSNAWMLLVLGWVATSFPLIVSIRVMRVLTPFQSAVAINMEPVYTILIALMLYGKSEWMSSGFYAGAAVLFMTTIMLTARSSHA
jgi:drug/metabolite transporter (DMT)-like permease